MEQGTQRKTVTQQVREFGAHVKKDIAGYYIYKGKNFTAPFNIASCESTWWEVAYWEDNIDPRVRNTFDACNQFDTKRDIVYQLLILDKSISDGTYEPIPNFY